MEESSLKQFATEKNLRKKGLLKATIEFVDEIKKLGNSYRRRTAKSNWYYL